MKLIIYITDEHDHSVSELDGKEVWSNDYGYENVIRLCQHMGIEWEIVELDRQEFEDRYA